MSDMGQRLPSILEVVVAAPFDQVVPAVSYSALAQDGIHFKDSTTAICIDRRRLGGFCGIYRLKERFKL